MKKMLSLLLAVCLLVGALPLTAGAESSVVASGNCGAQGGNVTWVLTDDGTITISGTGAMADFTFSTDEYGTFTSNNPYYKYRSQITKAEIESGVTYIGNQAFYGFSTLSTVSTSFTVTEIGNGAFRNCTNLTEITIRYSVKTIADDAFEGDANLTIRSEKTSYARTYAEEHSIPFLRVNASAGVNGISGSCGENLTWELAWMLTISGTGAMYEYPYQDQEETLWYWYNYENNYEDVREEITQVIVEEGVTTIGNRAFWGCSSLTTIIIPSSVVDIGEEAFKDCTSLKNVFVAKENQAYYDNDGILFSKDGTEMFYPSDHPDESCTIPASVTNVWSSNWNNVTEISVESGNAKYYSKDGILFQHVTDSSDCLVRCPPRKSGEVIIPDNVTSVNDDAFRNCSSLTAVTIPNSVTSIGTQSFLYCDSLVTITIPKSVTEIGYDAFYGCDNLTICGYKGSAAEEYAQENIIPFVALDDESGSVSGTCGENLTWTLEGGELTISGEGEITEYPWREYEDQIYSMVIGSGVTGVGNTFFEPEQNASHLSNLGYIEVENGNPQYYSEDGMLFSYGSRFLPEEYQGRSCLEVCPPAKEGTADCTSADFFLLAYAFKGCSGISTIRLPSDILWAGKGFEWDSAFADCASLTSINIESGGHYQSINGCVYSIAENSMLLCPPGRKTCTIAEGTTSIDNYAFGSHSYQFVEGYKRATETIVIPSSVTSGLDSLLPLAEASSKKIAIYGDAGSAAETFAKEHSDLFTFINGRPENGSCGGNTYWKLDEVTGVLSIAGTGKIEYSPWLDYGYEEQITSIEIGAGINAISDNILMNWSTCLPELSEISVDKGNSVFSDIDGVLYNKQITELLIYPPARSDASYTLPASIVKINYSFYVLAECSNLSEILVEDGNQAFFSADGVLVDKEKGVVRVPPQKAGIIDLRNCKTRYLGGASNPFSGCTKITKLILGSNWPCVTEKASPWMTLADCTSLTEIQITSANDGKRTVNGCVYNQDDYLEFVPPGQKNCAIAEDAAGIDVYAFWANPSCPIESVVIPNDTIIETNAMTGITDTNELRFEFEYRSEGNPNKVIIYGDANSKVEAFAQKYSSLFTFVNGRPKGYTSVYLNKPSPTPKPNKPSGGSSDPEPAEPDTIKNPDGSTTVTEIAADGTMTTTTTWPNGKTEEKVEKPDGSTVTTTTEQDGKSIVEEKSPEGTVTTFTTWPDGRQAVDMKALDGGKTISVTSAAGEMMANVKIPAKPGEGKVFEDVKAGSWYKDFVDKATGYGLFNGTSETKFSPNEGMTRGMLVQVLHNLSGKAAYGVNEGAFSDVTANAWYKEAVGWGYKAGITAGTGAAQFSPDKLITREQLVMMLYHYADLIGADCTKRVSLAAFPDGGKVTDYARNAMRWAVAEGFISGRETSGGNYIAPQGTAARAEVAVVLSRFAAFLKK